jgi:hypothetical protein
VEHRKPKEESGGEGAEAAGKDAKEEKPEKPEKEVVELPADGDYFKKANYMVFMCQKDVVDGVQEKYSYAEFQKSMSKKVENMMLKTLHTILIHPYTIHHTPYSYTKL